MLAELIFYLRFIFYYAIIMSIINLIRGRLFPGKSIMIILGSGGHTGEILLMLKKLNLKLFSQVYFLHAHNDTSSKAKAFEMLDLKSSNNYTFIQVYRSRNVGQSFKSSIFSTIVSLFHSLLILLKTRPNLVKNNFFILCFFYLLDCY